MPFWQFLIFEKKPRHAIVAEFPIVGIKILKILFKITIDPSDNYGRIFMSDARRGRKRKISTGKRMMKMKRSKHAQLSYPENVADYRTTCDAPELSPSAGFSHYLCNGQSLELRESGELNLITIEKLFFGDYTIIGTCELVERSGNRWDAIYSIEICMVRMTFEIQGSLSAVCRILFQCAADGCEFRID